MAVMYDGFWWASGGWKGRKYQPHKVSPGALQLEGPIHTVSVCICTAGALQLEGPTHTVDLHMHSRCSPIRGPHTHCLHMHSSDNAR